MSVKSRFLAILTVLTLFAVAATAPRGNVQAGEGTTAALAPSLGKYEGEVIDLNEPASYIIQLEAPALATYRGGIAGLAATNPAANGQTKIENNAATAAYLDYLAGAQASFLNSVDANLGRAVEVKFTYRHAFNGLALIITPAEADQIAAMDGVKMVTRTTVEEVLTDSGPAWIGAPGIWDGSGAPDGLNTRGEGVVVAILDTGVNSLHPSFADVGQDGYDHTNPLGSGTYLGVCDSTNPDYQPAFVCNDKLIGVHDFIDGDGNDPNSPEDGDGHGSHTGSTVAGNVVTATLFAPTAAITDTISGVAPHANIIAYDVCRNGPSDQGGGCPGDALLAAVNQVIADDLVLPNGVAVINYSISGGVTPYGDPVELAFLAATDAGVFVSASAGNAGPGAGTVAHVSPWVATIAASTHNRSIINQVTGITSAGGGLADITGLGFTAGYGPAPLLYAGDFGDALCLNPFAGGTFSGEIVICDRGTNARVDKGANVLAGGAGGMILADNGAGLVGDAHFLPAVHITLADGTALKTWLAANPDGEATISGFSADLDPANGDIMAGFSSRGPVGAFGVLKPDVTAPGVDIWAAVESTGDATPDYGFISGTSMSSPHNAGAAALMAALYPTWTPHQIKSALMLTADNVANFKEDGATPADPFDLGAGRIQVAVASNAGFVLNETTANFEAADPALNAGQETALQQLNVASLANSGCFGTCVWVREIESTMAVTTSWVITPEMPAGLTMTVDPASFDLAPGASQVITFTADVSNIDTDVWTFGHVWFTEVSAVPYAVVELSKSDGDVTAEAGDTITYTLSYVNTGDGTATGVWITETVPANTTFNAAASSAGWTAVDADTYTFSIGSLAPTEADMVYFAVDVDSDIATTITSIDNMAYITGDDLSVGNASDSTPVTHTGSPAMEFAKSDGGVSAEAGDTITYTLTYTNSGDTSATGVWITETVPANTTFNAAASSAGWTAAGGDTYTYMVGTVADGATAMVYFAVDVDSDIANTVTAINNTAHIDGDNIAVITASDSTPVTHAEPAPVIYLPLIFRDSTGNSPDMMAALALGRGFAGGDTPAMGMATVGLAPVAHMPMAAISVSCAAPDLLTFEVDTDMGSEDRLLCAESLEVTDLQVELAGLTEGTVYTDSLSVDPTNGDPYDNLNDGTVTFITVTVNSAARLVAEIVASEAPDLDLYVGTGDTPSAGTQVCASASGIAIEYCNINDPADGTWWVVVQNWAASGAPPDDVTFVVASVEADAGNWDVTSPNIAGGDPLTATISWNEPGFDIGTYWYGDFVLGTDAGHPSNLARVNANFVVVGTPVIETDTTDLASAQPSGEVVTFTMAISNTGTGDLDWNITEDNDTLMRGVQGSVLYDNGPFITTVGGGAGGADESAITAGLGNFGFGHSSAGGVRVSDQFTVTDAAGWTVTNFTFYGYQTGSTTASTFTGIDYNIWDGPPGVGGSAIIYTSDANALSSTAWSNVYRVQTAGNGNTTRPIMTNNASADVFLPQGTYWVDWASTGSLASGPWVPPITIVGQTTTGDARQFTAGNWGDLLDTTFPQGLPFMVEGFVGGAALPCTLTSPIAWASATPNSGTTAPGDATAVEVTFDSTGLAMGTYEGYLCVNSNDAVTPQISIPVSLTVTSSPVLINLNLSEVTSTQDAGTTTNQDLEIGNPGGGTLNWSIDEVDGFLRPVASADVVESVETISFAPQAGFGLTGSGLSAAAGLTALPAAQRVPNQTITHSTSQTVTAGSISCNSGGLHADNSYWRAFDLPSFGINGAFDISSVDVGVETANGASGSQPVVLRLYAAPSGTAFPAAFPGSFNLIATENVDVANQTLSLLNIPVAAVVPANSVLVMELFTPSGQATNNSFFVGSNASGQSAPSYIASAPCGIATPTDLAAIGFGNMHIVMNVTGDEVVGQTCDTAVDIPWLTLNPTSGSAGAGITNTVNVSLDSTGLPAGVYTGTLCVNSNASNAPLVEVPVAMTVTVPTASSIDMAMTVGTDSSVCAATDDITVASGTEVTYCYEVTNTGAITLTQHDLMDTELGTVLNAFPYSLAPGASAFITATTTLTATTVSTATWTAYNLGPTDTAMASDSATVNMAAGNATVTYCRNAVNIAIPDGNPAGVDDSLTVTESGTIVDVNFFVNATHTWNGDVAFRLTHNALTLAMVDRPGVPASTFGCSGDNFPNMTLDDEATTPGTPVETSCTATVPGYPANSAYTPNAPLSGFDGGNLNGTWTLNSSDSVTPDAGTVVDWCVVIEYTP